MTRWRMSSKTLIGRPAIRLVRFSDRMSTCPLLIPKDSVELPVADRARKGRRQPAVTRMR
jgi:hypothetical protein